MPRVPSLSEQVCIEARDLYARGYVPTAESVPHLGADIVEVTNPSEPKVTLSVVHEAMRRAGYDLLYADADVFKVGPTPGSREEYPSTVGRHRWIRADLACAIAAACGTGMLRFPRIASVPGVRQLPSESEQRRLLARYFAALRVAPSLRERVVTIGATAGAEALIAALDAACETLRGLPA